MFRFALDVLESVVPRRLLLLVGVLVMPLGAFGQTADDIIAKYIEARGGLAKIRSIQTERVTGTIVFTPTVQGPFVVERERPLKMRMQLTLGEQTLIRVYDGKAAGWIYNPFASNPAVEPMNEADLHNILEEADFEGPFINYQSKGNQVEYAGKTTVEGKSAYKLKLTNKNGDVTYFSFDASSYMMLRFEGTRKSGDKDVASQTFFRNFREVDGLTYPFLVESFTPATGESQKILADKIEVNVSISESRFRKPEVPANAPASARPQADPSKPN